jgi:hypothetical protein
MQLTKVVEGINTQAVLPALPPWLAMTQGKIFFVKPRSGSDFGNDGHSPDTALKTLKEALARATAGQNDIVILMGESNTASHTTDYQSATLDWNKDLVHLIGVGSGPLFSQRARVAFTSTFVGAANLFTLSANGCFIADISFYAGVASANPTGCMKITGQRNHIQRCHIAGMGHASMDIAGAYSLQISAGQENLIEDCVIGQDTVTLGAAVNAVLYFASGATRNTFRNCQFMLYTSHATNAQFVRAAAGSMDRFQVFDRCAFINAVSSGSTVLTQAMTVVAGGSPSGGIILRNPVSVGSTDWNATDAGNVYATVESATANAIGLAVAILR